ncbi:hypothetical protein [Nocardia sp. Marseille-Q1738]
MSVESWRTSLDWARDIAHLYRRALYLVDPERCEKLDEQARAKGHHWIAPQPLTAEAAEEVITSVVVPVRMAEIIGTPVGTIYSWISRGLLKPVPDETGPAKYLVRDALVLQTRRQVRRLDIA